ncbi:MAG: phenylalanine--tRNA ligase subunit beta [Candidatus Omnitrophica bacterium]|nr:phenylalanine--tRNA ligase subunit beta [Candidatus Omnitrophota bacterium]
MKLSYDWLKEYADINVSPEELAHGLTMSGSEVEGMHDSGKDKVMELEITSNRPDCLNIIGLAREAAAVFDKDLKLPEFIIPENTEQGKGPKVECVIKDKDLCPRYTARVIAGVTVKEATDGIEKRIKAMGLRAVNNIVDVTNYCLMETGQPLHAFDLDKVRGGKIMVRKAVRGEKIVAIDEVEHELKPGMLVIADSRGPIAIAGVMGGKETEVTSSTKNILLESAYFDPISVRQTARELGLSSDSSYRFERGVDKGMIRGASDRAAGLILKEAGGKICELYDAGKLASGGAKIKFSVPKAGKLLDIALKQEEVKRIFEKLGLKILEEDEGSVLVEAPTFREDLKSEIDLTEEVARIYGYDNIPGKIEKFIPQVKRKEKTRLVKEKLVKTLSALGLDEIMTYSLINEAAVNRFGSISKDTVDLENPISGEHKTLTPHLLDGMLRSISWNINRKNRDLFFFELGKKYSRKGKGPDFQEVPLLCMGLTGLKRRNWMDGERQATVYDLKGTLEVLFSRLRLAPGFSKRDVDGMINCASVLLKEAGGNIGFLGQVNKKVLDEYDIEQKVYICQIELDRIMEETVLLDHYRSIPRFPEASRDVSILCDQAIAADDIASLINKTGEDIVREIELVDVYEGKQIPENKKSLTYNIKYSMDTRTLTDEEIEAVHESIKEALVKELGIEIR